mmetsp:Transcript_159846/g.512927  ORF Transcript_159846/g.512927 Transcript_159846/m.512927 type:complete len:205 (+) Transcript_159846:520-1134(+)
MPSLWDGKASTASRCRGSASAAASSRVSVWWSAGTTCLPWRSRSGRCPRRAAGATWGLALRELRLQEPPGQCRLRQQVELPDLRHAEVGRCGVEWRHLPLQPYWPAAAAARPAVGPCIRPVPADGREGPGRAGRRPRPAGRLALLEPRVQEPHGQRRFREQVELPDVPHAEARYVRRDLLPDQPAWRLAVPELVLQEPHQRRVR